LPDLLLQLPCRAIGHHAQVQQKCPFHHAMISAGAGVSSADRVSRIRIRNTKTQRTPRRDSGRTASGTVFPVPGTTPQSSFPSCLSTLFWFLVPRSWFLVPWLVPWVFGYLGTSVFPFCAFMLNDKRGIWVGQKRPEETKKRKDLTPPGRGCTFSGLCKRLRRITVKRTHEGWLIIGCWMLVSGFSLTCNPSAKNPSVPVVTGREERSA
jgi:hypothetical protein